MASQHARRQEDPAVRRGRGHSGGQPPDTVKKRQALLRADHGPDRRGIQEDGGGGYEELRGELAEAPRCGIRGERPGRIHEGGDGKSWQRADHGDLPGLCGHGSAVRVHQVLLHGHVHDPLLPDRVLRSSVPGGLQDQHDQYDRLPDAGGNRREQRYPLRGYGDASPE